MVLTYSQVEAIGVTRYKVEPRRAGFWPYCVKAGGGTMELFIGSKGACEDVAQALQTAFLDGAFVSMTGLPRG